MINNDKFKKVYTAQSAKKISDNHNIMNNPTTC